MVSLIDLILILFLFGFIFYGFFFGLIRTIGAIAGVVVGAWAASSFYLVAYSMVKGFFLGYDTFGRILVFLIIFSVVKWIVSFAFAALDKTFNLISIIPFLSSINKIAGAIFGLLLGALVLGIAFHIILSIPFIGAWLNNYLSVSELLPYIVAFNKLIAPLLPKIIEKVKGI